jgi:hypothetical protein
MVVNLPQALRALRKVGAHVVLEKSGVGEERRHGISLR